MSGWWNPDVKSGQVGRQKILLGWRNWQTHWLQEPAVARLWEIESPAYHLRVSRRRRDKSLPAGRQASLDTLNK